MYRYETHLHTLPVSKCAKSTVREHLEYYKSLGYQGVFITNHFLDGNIDIDRSLPYAERIEFYFRDCEEGKRLAKEIGIEVFEGVEMSYAGTDFLVYGLDKQWYLQHPEIEGMKKTQELKLLIEAGALVIQAHPYREASYIDHIRLYPRHVQGVEVFNACRTEAENAMAAHYAEAYGLIPFAGTDNHRSPRETVLAGMETETPITDEQDFIRQVFSGELKPFVLNLQQA